MTTPVSVRPDRGAESERTAGRKDALLDLIRSVAVIRVVLWHTWSWAWLSWIPAMPAMFFTTGALLEGSLRRRSWVSVLRTRARRLFIPYWVYAVACLAVMTASGWRPELSQVAAWILPLSDPVGSDAFPGLWIPLWYVRAYLWFLLAGGILRWLHVRLGWWSVVIAAAVGTTVWWVGHLGHTVPAAIGDAAAYAPFVLAGMLHTARRSVSAPLAAALGVGGLVAALVVWQSLGPADGIVNRSYLLTMLVGLAGVGLVLAAAPALLRFTRPGRSVITTINSRALTIYLWQGFGLVAAQRLFGTSMDRWWKPAASIVVVAAVIAGAVAACGWLEDLAARRTRTTPLGSRPALGVLAVVCSLAVIGAGLVRPGDGLDAAAPLSGRAVVERSRHVEESLTGQGDVTTTTVVPGMTVQDVLEEWAEENASVLRELDSNWVDVAVAFPSGATQRASWTRGGAAPRDRVLWWSMSKTVTTAWLMRLVERGVVSLDDPLATWVPETPRAQDMTLEHLARHISGIPADLDRNFILAHPAEEIADFIDHGELASEPGEQFGYSRVGYFLLALALERASGQPYGDAVAELASLAGVEVVLDDEMHGPATAELQGREITDPDGHGYRGGPWASGGIVSDLDNGVRFLQWIFGAGVSAESLDAMTAFSSSQEHWHYGLGLIPLCPCRADGDVIRSDRFGLDALPGTYGYDRGTGATVMVTTENWWLPDGPADAFVELQNMLLDIASAEADPD